MTLFTVIFEIHFAYNDGDYHGLYGVFTNKQAIADALRRPKQWPDKGMVRILVYESEANAVTAHIANEELREEYLTSHDCVVMEFWEGQDLEEIFAVFVNGAPARR
jgi:hypothetical protein